MTAALLVVALLLAVAPGAVADEAPVVTPPRLSYLDGAVSFWRPGADNWAPAQLNMVLAPGDELHTGHPGNAELQVGARAFVRAWGDTQFGVANHTPDLLQLRVTAGHVALDARALDADQIEQVLINLIKNAVESGSPEDEVTLGVSERYGGVSLEVSDRGSGLTPEVLRDALLPFYSTKPKGTGLGLTLCREIVDAHGGRLSIANREGGGAVVTVWLPKGDCPL